jgi:CDP-diacylglycerol--glycerol-3-phosphate 3-phosphatidyltransferase
MRERAQQPLDLPSDADTTAVVTVPNALVAVRILGTGVILWLAWAGFAGAFCWLLVALLVTDWLDGKLAILLHQRSVLGARLDSFADVFLYASLVVCVFWLRPDVGRTEAILIATAVISYALSSVVGLVRLGQIPAYHTRAAKICWLLIGVGAVIFFASGPSWPLQAALAAVTVTNLEAIAISFVLPRWEPNVASLYHALRRRNRT